MINATMRRCLGRRCSLGIPVGAKVLTPIAPLMAAARQAGFQQNVGLISPMGRAMFCQRAVRHHQRPAAAASSSTGSAEGSSSGFRVRCHHSGMPWTYYVDSTTTIYHVCLWPCVHVFGCPLFPRSSSMSPAAHGQSICDQFVLAWPSWLI